ncbi:MAG: RHS repeat-associated core domain-containing protein [Phycisphaerae bacterium]
MSAVDYGYLDNRDLVASITCGNGTMNTYDYDDADRVKLIEHSIVGQSPFLSLVYWYDGRDLIIQIDETDENGFVTTVTFDYDARRRLTRETRISGGPSPEYDLEYTYDAGGNRELKIDHYNGTTTTYTYDVDDPAAYNHKANRLMSYETRQDSNNYVLERVVYEYALEGDAAGNITQVIRETPTFEAEQPSMFDVFGTHFTYNKKGAVRIIVQRHWRMIIGDTESHFGESVLKIREFRGDGRTRHMMRERDTAFPHGPLFDTAVWTDYNDDLPTGDYTVNGCVNQPGTPCDSIQPIVTEETHYDLGLAEMEYGPDPFSTTDDTVTYTHTNHLGTTRARTDDNDPVDFVARPVYTALGERVDVDGSIGTRYGYVGKEGYETFDNGDASPYFWGEWDTDGPGGDPPIPAPFGFIHTGARWYDPASGRFLQRDVLGVQGGLHTYLYGEANPTALVDPEGTFVVAAARAAGRAAWPYLLRGGEIVLAKGKSAFATIKRVRVKVQYHRKPHPFRWVGRRHHLQCTMWLKGRKGSDVNVRLPLP